MCEVKNASENITENESKNEGPETLYHYCSVQTFYDIIKNKSIWLSDLSKTNDSQELIWMKGIVERKLLPQVEKNIREEVSGWDEWKVTRDLLKHSDFKISCWGFCLSKKKDNLGQWRGYADDGAGIAIGFKYNVLKKFIPSTTRNSLSEPNLTLDEIHYKNEEELLEEITKKADEKADEIENGIENGIENKDICKIITELVNQIKGNSEVTFSSKEAAKIIVEALVAITEFPFYKMKAFEEEEEWRIVFSMSREQFSECAVKCYNWPSPLSFKEFGFNSSLVSHIDLGIKNFEDVIQSITIGPKSKLTEADIELILRYYDVYNESIKIEKSAASYR